MSVARIGVAAALLLALALAFANDALACACCSERGWRTDKSMFLDKPTRVQLDRMVFGKDAMRAIGVADEKPGPLPAGAGLSYELTVTRDKGALSFALKDSRGRSGRLVFRIPPTIHVFAVDPFGETKDEGLGPSLYKEWRLTAPVTGDRVFRAPRGQTATLIFHGSGRGCTDADHFTDWSLQLQGPAGKATLYGSLETPL